MGLVDEYLFYQEKYEKIYGKNKTLVIMRCGSFFEAYSTKTRGYDLSKISDLLNIALTRKDKKIQEISESNPYMVGFPSFSLDKFLKILMDNNFTVVVVDQTTPPPNPKREITGIYSPGTYESSGSVESNNLICLYIEDERQLTGEYLPGIGITIIDTTTGSVNLHEAFASAADPLYSLDEAYRIIISNRPREILIYHNQITPIPNSKEKLISYLELETKKYYYSNQINKQFTKLSYQNQFLGKIYETNSMLTTLEYLDLEKIPYSRISLIILLDWIYKHNQDLVSHLDKPKINSDKNFLILGNDAIYQLNIFDNNHYPDSDNTKFKSLYDVVNNTSTAMGRRLLKYSLANPLTDISEINLRYQIIGTLLENNFYIQVENHLNSVLDIERLTRRLSLLNIHPFELANLLDSLSEIKIIIKLISDNINFQINKLSGDNLNQITNKLDQFISESAKIFNFPELKQQNLREITNSFFNPGVYPEIDQLQNQISDGFNIMDKLKNKLSDFIEDKNKSNLEKIYLKKTDRDGYYLSLTKLRAKTLRDNIKNLEKIKISDNLEIQVKDLEFKELTSGNTKIFFTELTKNSNKVTNLNGHIIELIHNYYKEILTNFSKNYGENLRDIALYIGKIDFLKSCAKTAKLYNYTRPVINHNNNYGYIQTKKLRHPIVERLHDDVEYIPHDISLGKPDLKGLLIYSINSGGKCFAPDTKILLYSGESKPARDIKIMDQLMGDDSNPRLVLSLTQDIGQLYKILTKNNKPIIINGPHILCLKNSDNQILEITLENFINKPDNFKSQYYLYRNQITNSNLKFKNQKSYLQAQGWDLDKNLNKISNLIPFKIKKYKIGPYIGFQVDSKYNQRFLLSNYIVTHNSCLQKSVGLAIIMAQAGMFVPASQFEYSPYESVYARITGNDNIFKGLSSFALEMTELNAILTRASPKSLVIGDEICRGTEHVSATAIVATAVAHLAKTESSFIFATHLHEILNIGIIQELKTVKAYHLMVNYDEKSDMLIFNRKLQEGSGPPIYGLTVASSIIKNKEFIHMAQQVKNELINKSPDIIIPKQSRYNSNIYMDSCQLCGKSANKNQIPLESHHIIQQEKYANNSVPEEKAHILKNQRANLVVLCQACHDKIHNLNLKLEYRDTSKGKKLLVEKI